MSSDTLCSLLHMLSSLASRGKLVFPPLAHCLGGRKDMRCYHQGSPNLKNWSWVCLETHFILERRTERVDMCMALGLWDS